MLWKAALKINMAGVPGFEPGSADTKNRCLTAWLYPSKEWWPETESNRRHEDFQSSALPTELSGQRGVLNRIAFFSSTVFSRKVKKIQSLNDLFSFQEAHTRQQVQDLRNYQRICPSQCSGILWLPGSSYLDVFH